MIDPISIREGISSMLQQRNSQLLTHGTSGIFAEFVEFSSLSQIGNDRLYFWILSSLNLLKFPFLPKSATIDSIWYSFHSLSTDFCNVCHSFLIFEHCILWNSLKILRSTLNGFSSCTTSFSVLNGVSCCCCCCCNFQTSLRLIISDGRGVESL